MTSSSTLLLSLLLLFETSFAICKYKFIHNASELIEFSNEVNNGMTDYSDYTVYLVADINFNQNLSSQFNPISNGINFFSGTFDGQGYVVSNLKTSSSLRYAGLFGYVHSATVRNVVVDSSCSVTNSGSYNVNGPFVGGIIGYHLTNGTPCIIENSVNMGSVTFRGNSINLYIGGVIGAVSASPNGYSKIENCVNYGAIYTSGSVTQWIDVGGVIGEIHKLNVNYMVYLSNCLNYGTVTNTCTGSVYFVGGIDGTNHGITMTNCMSTGAVSNTRGASGGIIGNSGDYPTTINHCCWTSATNRNYYYGLYPQYLTYSSSQKIASITSTDADWLNSCATSNKWNEWVYNQYSKNIKFIVHDGKGFSYSSQLILFPVPARRGYAFLFWCMNQNSTSCSKKYVRPSAGFTAETTLYAQWVVTNCTVVFDVNGGYELPDDEKNRTKVYEEEIGELPVTSRRGYTFTGWYTAYDEQFTNESLVNNVCNCSLIAHWNPNNYTVFLDVNRGNILDNNILTVTFDSTYGTIPSPTRDGFSFSGWFTKDYKQITEKTVVNITSTQTLYAHWGPKTYTVTLDVNGGNAIPTNKRKVPVFADTAYYNLTMPTRRGYTFAGWYTADGGLITNDTATTAIITKDQTLYAHWTANNYTVSFDVNGGDEFIEEEDKNKTVTFNTIYDYLPSPTRIGYTFDWWVTENNKIITNTTIVNFAYDHTLYAWWTANEYNIEFDPNGGDGLTIITVTFNRSYDCLPTPTREGYTFLWWCIKGTNEIVYNTTTVLTACDHTLCAVWNRNTIIFDVNGGNTLPDEDTKMEVTYEGTYQTLPTPTRTGYTFDGWYTDDGVKTESGSTVKISSDQTLHARWTPNSYTMPLNANGGKVTDSKVIVIYHDYYGNLPTPTRTGYTFIGWYTENGDLITINTIVTDPCHCVLSAGWEPNTYIINFVTNGGKELGENEVEMEVEYDGVYGLLPTPTRKGYTFVGWFNGNGNEIKTGMKVDVADNQTFTAEWTPNEYTVEFNPNGCNEIIKREEKEEGMEEEKEEMKEIKEIEVTYDATYDSLPTPERAGYEFDGWFNEDGVLITSETKVEIADNHALCAEWTPSNYTVTFDVNGGDELVDNEKETRVTYGGTYKDLPTPTWKGHKFAGWFTEDGAEEITADTIIDVTEDQTLFAHWDEVISSQIEVTFEKKEMSEDEIKEMLRIFTDAEFGIISIEHNEAGETIAIIRFDDISKAEEFIRNLMGSSDEARKFIRVAYSSSKVEVSTSIVFYPNAMFNIMLI